MKNYPILPNQYLEIKSEDGIDVTFSLAYLVDNKQPEFMVLTNKQEKAKKAFYLKAKDIVTKKTKGKKLKKGQLEKLIDDEARQLYLIDISEDPYKHQDNINSYIDMFCVKTFSEDKKFMNFPKDYPKNIKLSSTLSIEDKLWLFSEIMSNMEDLAMLGNSFKKK